MTFSSVTLRFFRNCAVCTICSLAAISCSRAANCSFRVSFSTTSCLRSVPILSDMSSAPMVPPGVPLGVSKFSLSSASWDAAIECSRLSSICDAFIIDDTVSVTCTSSDASIPPVAASIPSTSSLSSLLVWYSSSLESSASDHSASNTTISPQGSISPDIPSVSFSAVDAW